MSAIYWEPSWNYDDDDYTDDDDGIKHKNWFHNGARRVLTGGEG